MLNNLLCMINSALEVTQTWLEASCLCVTQKLYMAALSVEHNRLMVYCWKYINNQNSELKMRDYMRLSMTMRMAMNWAKVGSFFFVMACDCIHLLVLQLQLLQKDLYLSLN